MIDFGLNQIVAGIFGYNDFYRTSIVGGIGVTFKF